MSDRQTKQVIIIRKDLKMRRGKECAQAAHASMAALLKSGIYERHKTGELRDVLNLPDEIVFYKFDTPPPVEAWLKGSFTKVTVTVDSEQELLDLEQKAKEANILHCLITDNGKTEFNGVPTKTVLAIGPGWSDEIDKITGNLKLY